MRRSPLIALSLLAFASPAMATVYTADYTLPHTVRNAVWTAADSISGFDAYVSGALDVQAGIFSPGTLNMTTGNGASVSQSPIVKVSGGTFSPGAIVMDGNSTLQVNALAGAGNVANGGVVNLAANLTLTAGGTFTNEGIVTVGAGSVLTATSFDSTNRDATVAGSGRIIGTSALSGTIAPGTSTEDGDPVIGTLSFTGDTTFLSDAQLVDGNTIVFLNLIHDDNTQTWDLDKIDITGQATLGGRITPFATPSDALRLGDRFEFLTASSISGVFDPFDPFLFSDFEVYDDVTQSFVMARWTIEYDTTGPEQGATLVIGAVPEPGAIALLAIVPLLAGRRRAKVTGR